MRIGHNQRVERKSCAHQATESQVIICLNGLIEVEAETGLVLTHDARVVVADRGGNAMCNHRRDRMVQDVGRKAKHLVRDRAHLDHDAFLLDLLHELRVLVQREAMPNASRVEENGVKQVRIRAVAVSQRLSRVEKEWQGDVVSLHLLLKPDQLGRQVRQRTAEIFLRNQIITAEQFRVVQLSLNRNLHGCVSNKVSLMYVARAHTHEKNSKAETSVVGRLTPGKCRTIPTPNVGPDDPDAPKIPTLCRGLELAHLIQHHLPPKVQIWIGDRQALGDERRRRTTAPEFDPRHPVIRQTLKEAFPIPTDDGLVVQRRADGAEAALEFPPDGIDAKVMADRLFRRERHFGFQERDERRTASGVRVRCDRDRDLGVGHILCGIQRWRRRGPHRGVDVGEGDCGVQPTEIRGEALRGGHDHAFGGEEAVDDDVGRHQGRRMCMEQCPLGHPLHNVPQLGAWNIRLGLGKHHAGKSLLVGLAHRTIPSPVVVYLVLSYGRDDALSLLSSRRKRTAECMIYTQKLLGHSKTKGIPEQLGPRLPCLCSFSVAINLPLASR